MPIEGQRIQHYRVEKSLGAGGMGEVFVALDERLQRRVALKAIKPEHQMRPAERQRLLAEARLISKLEHPSICRLYDYLDDGMGHYLVLELIRGKSLQEVLRKGDRSRRMRLEWAIQIAEGLVAAHGAGVVHHDLKPANVMVSDEDAAKILDFGVAQLVLDPAANNREREQTGEDAASGNSSPQDQDDLDATATSASVVAPPSEMERERSQAGDEEATFADDDRTQTASPTATPTATSGKRSVGGTPLYMSPEQARGEQTGTASDMFSFGLLLHEMFTGSRAYSFENREEFLRRVPRGETDSARTHNRDLTHLIENLKQLSPSRRPTAIEALRVLRWVQGRRARVSRRTIAAAVLGAATLGGVKYTLDVSRQKEIAETRRGQAEQLIEFMLGDLRERLEPVGRLDALSAVGDEALDYFEVLDMDEMSPEDRERYGRTLTHIGEVKFAEGKFDEALQTYEESREIYDRLVIEQSDKPHLKHGLGGAHFGVGRVYWERDEIDAASESFDSYLELAESAFAQDPTDPRNRLELGYALNNVAAVNEALGDVEAAISGLNRAIEVNRAVVEAEPESLEPRESLSMTIEWLARIEEDRGNLLVVSALRDQNLNQWREYATPENAQSRWMLAMAHAERGRIAEDLGDVATAAGDYQSDLGIMRSLFGLDPANTIWRRGLVISLQRIASSRIAAAPARRIELALEAIRHCEALLESDVDNIGWLRDRLSGLRVLAQAQADAGRYSAALHTLERFDSLPKRGNEAEERFDRAGVFFVKGRIALAQSRVDQAHAFWNDGLELIQDQEGRSFDVDWQIVELLDALGKKEDAVRLLSQFRQRGFEGPDFQSMYARYSLN